RCRRRCAPPATLLAGRISRPCPPAPRSRLGPPGHGGRRRGRAGAGERRARGRPLRGRRSRGWRPAAGRRGPRRERRAARVARGALSPRGPPPGGAPLRRCARPPGRAPARAPPPPPAGPNGAPRPRPGPRPGRDRARAGALLADAVIADPALLTRVAADHAPLLARLRFLAHFMPDCGLPGDPLPLLADAIRACAAGGRSVAELQATDLGGALRGLLTHAQRTALERDAPSRFRLPTGPEAPIAYEPHPPP